VAMAAILYLPRVNLAPGPVFVVLASVMVGVGTFGNLVASYPMAIAAENDRLARRALGLATITDATGDCIWCVGVATRPPPRKGTNVAAWLGVL